MTKEEFKKKYNNTKMYIGKNATEVFKLIYEAYGIMIEDKSSPFLYIKDNKVFLRDNMEEFTKSDLKEVYSAEFANEVICKYKVGDIIVFDKALALVKKITSNIAYINAYTGIKEDKFTSISLKINLGYYCSLASAKQKEEFIKEILS